MTTKRLVEDGLVVLAVAACLAIMACGGGKGHCASCSNDSDCSSGECATFVSNGGDKTLLCGNGSSTGRDTCNVAR